MGCGLRREIEDMLSLVRGKWKLRSSKLSATVSSRHKYRYVIESIDHPFKNPAVTGYGGSKDAARLYAYHILIMDEMVRRGFNPDVIWYDRLYRGKNLSPFTLSETGSYGFLDRDVIIYPEHDDVYLAECLDNLVAKGAELVNGESLASMRVRLAAKKGV